MLDTPIIVSDERLTHPNKGFTFVAGQIIKDCIGGRKIIAGIEGLPSIDWNGLEDEFGWVDVEKLAINATKKQMIRIFGNESKEEIEDDIQKRKYYFKEGFNKAQSLNEKKFSLEDMFKCFQAGIDYEKEGSILQPDAHGYIRSLQQPKVFDIEVEMYRPNEAYQISEHWSPKITNNSIKIIKKL